MRNALLLFLCTTQMEASLSLRCGIAACVTITALLAACVIPDIVVRFVFVCRRVHAPRPASLLTENVQWPETARKEDRTYILVPLLAIQLMKSEQRSFLVLGLWLHVPGPTPTRASAG